MSANSLYLAKEITNCARCNQTHKDLWFKKFTRPFEDYLYFALCPTNQEPILMKIVQTGVAQVGEAG